MNLRTPHALLAMAERGLAVIPSALRTDRHALRIVRLSYQAAARAAGDLPGQAAPAAGYATAFCAMLADHMRKVFPITRPSGSKANVSAPGRRAQTPRAVNPFPAATPQVHSAEPRRFWERP